MDNQRKKVIPHKLEETETNLYNRRKEPEIVVPHELHEEEDSIPNTWRSEPTMQKTSKKKHLLHSKTFRNLFLVGIIFFVGAFVFSLLTIFRGGATVSNNNIDIIVLGNSFVDGGEELLLELKVANRNRTPIEIADMLVEYSRGVGGANDMVRERVSLGEIRSGGQVSEIVPVTLFGEQGSVRTLQFTLEYRVSNSNAIFVKDYSYDVTIANSPVDVLVEGPSEVVSNQEFTTTISINQNSTEVSENMMVIANYPSGFKFESAVPEPDFGNNRWLLGDLAPGSEKQIKITGSIRASSGDQRIITIVSGTQDGEDEQSIGVQFTATPHAILIGSPFLSLEVTHDGESGTEFSIPGSGESQFIVQYTNPLTETLRDVDVVLRFSGSGFDPNRVTVNQGFFDVGKNAIVWSHTNNNDLDSVSPGQSGELYFYIQPKSGIQNGSISLALDASGVLVGASGGRENVTNIYTGTIRVSSAMSISARLLHQSGPFTNTGNLPPKVGQETTYTVEWTVGSPGSSVEDIEISTELPSYVSWKGSINPLDENIEYNPNNRRVIWRPSDMNAGAPSKTASFKIGFVPSLSQVGLSPSLTGLTSLSAHDGFSDISLSASFTALTSVLSNDTNYNLNNDKVVE